MKLDLSTQPMLNKKFEDFEQALREDEMKLGHRLRVMQIAKASFSRDSTMSLTKFCMKLMRNQDFEGGLVLQCACIFARIFLDIHSDDDPMKLVMAHLEIYEDDLKWVSIFFQETVHENPSGLFDLLDGMDPTILDQDDYLMALAGKCGYHRTDERKRSAEELEASQQMKKAAEVKAKAARNLKLQSIAANCHQVLNGHLINKYGHLPHRKWIHKDFDLWISEGGQIKEFFLYLDRTAPEIRLSDKKLDMIAEAIAYQGNPSSDQIEPMKMGDVKIEKTGHLTKLGRDKYVLSGLNEKTAADYSQIERSDFSYEPDPVEVERRLDKERRAALYQQKMERENHGIGGLRRVEINEADAASDSEGAVTVISDTPEHMKKKPGRSEMRVEYHTPLEQVGVAEVSGWRPSMEDAALARELILKLHGKDIQVRMLGIFDGHSGARASSHAAGRFPHFFSLWIDRLSIISGQKEVIIWNAIKFAMVELDQEIRSLMIDGTTATVSIIMDDELWVANIGDSRTLLVDKESGESIQLTEDQKPSHEKYLRGIKKRKGIVIASRRPDIPRVQGWLAVARALGDREFPMVCSRPKITKFIPCKGKTLNDYILISGCDGVFEVETTSDVSKMAYFRYQNRASAAKIASWIARSAYMDGSTDNISTLVCTRMLPRSEATELVATSFSSD